MKNVRVLLVDDNMRFLESVENFLPSISGLHVVSVGRALSGEEAIVMSTSLRPDLILMDISLPGMSGLEATRLIKQSADAPHIVMLTVHENDEYRKAAKEAGADGFISKSKLYKELKPVGLSMFQNGL